MKDVAVPSATERLLRLLRRLLGLKPEVFDVNSKSVVEPFEKTVVERLLLFF